MAVLNPCSDEKLDTAGHHYGSTPGFPLIHRKMWALTEVCVCVCKARSHVAAEAPRTPQLAQREISVGI